jgi:hypothetical protein
MAKIDEFRHVENGMFAEDYIEILETENKQQRELLEKAFMALSTLLGNHSFLCEDSIRPVFKEISNFFGRSSM